MCNVKQPMLVILRKMSKRKVVQGPGTLITSTYKDNSQSWDTCILMLTYSTLYSVRMWAVILRAQEMPFPWESVPDTLGLCTNVLDSFDMRVSTILQKVAFSQVAILEKWLILHEIGLWSTQTKS